MNFKYKYETAAGRGTIVYVIGMFLSLTTYGTSTYCIQQTPASISNTPPSESVPGGGKPLAHTRTRTETATELTVLESLSLGHTVLPNPPKLSP